MSLPSLLVLLDGSTEECDEFYHRMAPGLDGVTVIRCVPRVRRDLEELFGERAEEASLYAYVDVVLSWLKTEGNMVVCDLVETQPFRNALLSLRCLVFGACERPCAEALALRDSPMSAAKIAVGYLTGDWDGVQ